MTTPPEDEFLRRDGRWAPPPGGSGGLDEAAIAQRLSDPTSVSGAALGEVTVLARRHDGTPLGGAKVVILTLTEDMSEVADIAVYDSLDEVGA